MNFTKRLRMPTTICDFMTRLCVTSDLHYGFTIDTRPILWEFFEEIRDENPPVDVLIIAGDIISHQQKQWAKAWRMIRSIIPNLTVLIVRGNHDYWDDKLNNWTYHRIMFDQRKVMQEHGIIYLEECPFLGDDITVFGFDGWYGMGAPPSNDLFHLPKKIQDVPTHDFFYHKAVKSLANIPDKKDDGAVQIVVTHFHPSDSPMGGPTDWWPLLKMKADILVFGHNHIQSMDEEDGVKIINPGSDYNDPRYILLEI